MAYIHMYTGATGGGTDGTLVSENTGLAPITTAVLNATNNEIGDPIKLALRCETGYNTSGNTTITPTGTSAAKWATPCWLQPMAVWSTLALACVAMAISSS